MTLPTLPTLPDQARQSVLPLPFGNITYKDSFGNDVTKGIYIYLLDQHGNEMQLPHGRSLDSTVIKTCNELANKLIHNELNKNQSFKFEEITGFKKDGIQINSNSHKYDQLSNTLWEKLENIIIDYFTKSSIPETIHSSTFPQARRRSITTLGDPIPITDPTLSFSIHYKDPKIFEPVTTNQTTTPAITANQSISNSIKNTPDSDEDDMGFGLFD
jgi:hypothetical protein